jgi:hypothetical protein
MPTLGPIKRRDLMSNLRKLGFDGPYTGGAHEYMKRGLLKLPHSESASGRYQLAVA